MAGSKKFGTFGGVFTPSILTILGVIMYLRLGWVVGNAGLYGSLIIIAIAHVISLTTGLSISSIATDKKVGAGGVYYVLSRSLGLPVGGAIGLTLFVGTALSIALYLVGFAESFNDYFGFDTSVNGLRISGSLALLALTTIALISTAVAIKTQFFIMAAIFVSLISIFLGTTDSIPQTISFFGIEGGASMEEVFAIFFPAVTGFTAGIAMSGDLRDPKKSIPAGTIAAIAVGFVVYVGLAIFISLSIEGGVLVSDNNILMKMALFAPAVVAGIWGATLSSALGGILGGPRILQAMSIDKITPNLFAKGKGKENEPWNALFLTVIIAQCGILIGELDLIARVVSMFYLAAYGFINISFFLESWASADFNPSFKVKRWVGLVGFIATFTVMFKLDMLAMIAAFLIIGGIYVWLQRKQISLGTGDIWLSVWNSLVKRGLRKLEAQDDHIRNWKPNVLLFSGGTEQRPHLLELGISVVGRNGMLTNFDLVENPSAPVLFPKNKEAVKDDLLERYGVFGKKIEVQNIFKGIENIASTFGFSGIEPNTVLMGWAKNTKDPIWFAQMTRQLINLDLNVLYLDYDERYGFRDYRRIDIWWRGISNNAELTLSICKFLLSSEKWREAEIRILMVNDTLQEGYERKIHQKLDEYRIPATVKVLNNAIEKKPFYEILRNTSADSSLIIVGIPPIPVGSEKRFVGDTSELFSVVGTTLLVKASDQMGSTVGAYELTGINTDEEIQLVQLETEPLAYPEDLDLATDIRNMRDELGSLAEEISKVHLGSFRNNYLAFVHKCEELIEEATEKAARAADLQKVRRVQITTIIEFNKQLNEFINEDLPYLSERLEDLASQCIDKFHLHSSELPEVVNRAVGVRELVRAEGDSELERNAKTTKNLIRKLGLKPTVKVPLRTIGKYHLETTGMDNMQSFQLKLGLATLTWQMKLKDAFLEALKVIDHTGSEPLPEVPKDRMIKVKNLINDQVNHLYNYLLQSSDHVCRLVISDATSIAAADIGISQKNKNVRLEDRQAELKGFSQSWLRNQTCLARQYALDATLHEVKVSVIRSKDRAWQMILRSMFDTTQKHLVGLKHTLVALRSRIESGSAFDKQDLIDIQTEFNPMFNDIEVNRIMKDLEQLARKVPETIEVLDDESMNAFSTSQTTDVETLSVDLRHLTNFLINTTLIRPLEQELQSTALTCRQIAATVVHEVRLVFYMVSEKGDTDEQVNLADLFAKAESTLEEGLDSLEQKKEAASNRLDDLFFTATSGLNARQLVEKAGTANSAMRKEAATFAVDRFRTGFANALDSGWTAISQAVSVTKEQLATNQRSAEGKEVNLKRMLLDHIDDVSPKPTLLDNIPYYYQQLFIGKQGFRESEFIGREKELEEAVAAIEWWNRGNAGAILVHGEPMSGKTHLAEMIAKRTGLSNIIRVDPPVSGTNREKDLLKVVSNLIDSEKGTDDPIALVSEPSVFIFNDVELWWERSQVDNTALRRIMRFIEEHGKWHCFILNSNSFAYNAMCASVGFERAVLSSIRIRPISNAALQAIVLKRHNAGGLTLSVGNDIGDTIPDRKMKHVFADLNRNANGNLGIALHLWLSSIDRYQDGLAHLEVKNVPPLPEMTDKRILVLLAQLVIHDRLSIARMKRIFGFKDRAQVMELLEPLATTGMLTEIMGATYMINPYVTGSVIRRPKQLKLT